MQIIDDDPRLVKLARHTVGFLKNTPIAKDRRELSECGSGVLVAIGGIKGVITAGHVIRELQKYGRGAVFPSLKHNKLRHPFEFDFADCQYVVIGSADSPDGPDLGFVRLPYLIEQRLQDNWLFYNFDVRLDHIVKNIEGTQLEDEVICGVVAEKTELKSQTAFSVVQTFVTALAFGVSFNGRAGSEKYDLFDFHIFHNEEVSMPNTYGGMSGSAIWKIGSTEGAEDRILYGIAFYETDSDDEGRRAIVCHGPESIYNFLAEAIREEFPNEFGVATLEAD